jgi:peptidoglycan hydrolase-like protein with peptidoglycan-binding domain
MTNFAKLVAIPDLDTVNIGLSPCHQATMLKIFGRPGALSKDCSDVTNSKLNALIETRNVGPFKATGVGRLLDDLQAIFSEVKEKLPEVFSQVKTDGMLCCRAVRGSTQNFSNHSWGTAIDIRFGDDSDEMGDGLMQLGTSALAPFFHVRGWYWGVGFAQSNPKREDSMHFEASDELIRKLFGGEIEALTLGLEADSRTSQAADRVPAVDSPMLRSALLQGNNILEAVADGHLVLHATGGRVEGIGPVQDALNQLGFTIDLGSSGQFNGFFGEKTRSAVEAFQTSANIDADGRVGSDTIRKLDQALMASEAGGGVPASTKTSAGTPHAVGACNKEIVLDDTVTIFKLKDRPGFFYQGRMTVDADGAPKCYHPKPNDDLGLDDLKNSTSNSRKFIQGQDGIGPATGFFVSQTSLHSGPENRCDSFVDAETVPYIVFYGKKKFPDVELGDVAMVVSLVTGKRSHATVADGNNNTKGEASMKTAKNLGLDPSPRVGGDQHFNYIYLIFPGTKFDPIDPPPHWPDATIRQIADAKFAEWGGMAQLRNCFPQIPAGAV